MNLLITGLLILTCYAVLLVQFYKAYKRHCTTPVDVVVKGCDIAVLNQRHILCLFAIAATVVYVGLTKSEWLLLRPALHVEAAIATIVAGGAVLAVSLSAARKVLRRNKLLAPVHGAPETYMLIRGLFLISYELFFRAILLQFCLVWVSVPVAIAINVVLYAVAHLFAPRQELAGTVPFGLLLCGITLFSQSILPAILLHLLLGLPHDLLLLSAPKLATKTSIS